MSLNAALVQNVLLCVYECVYMYECMYEALTVASILSAVVLAAGRRVTTSVAFVVVAMHVC